MSKRNAVEITLPHNVSLKVDKLTDRTFRTIKSGDYLQHTLNVRGTDCTFYGVVTDTEGSSSTGGAFRVAFGSEGGECIVLIPKDAKVSVYRPL